MSEVIKKYAKLNYSKDTLIHDFLEYLKKGNDNIPLDIINAKIDIIDILYAINDPVVIEDIEEFIVDIVLLNEWILNFAGLYWISFVSFLSKVSLRYILV